MGLDITWAVDWVRLSADVIAEHRVELITLDREIGDGDHGENMDRGFQAVLPKLDDLPAGSTPGDVLKLVATTLISTVGGAAGPLYGTAYLKGAVAAGSAASLDGPAIAAVLAAARDGIVAARQGRGRRQDHDRRVGRRPSTPPRRPPRTGRMPLRCSPPRPRPRGPAPRRPNRSSPARVARATSANGRRATATRAPSRRRCCCRPRPTRRPRQRGREVATPGKVGVVFVSHSARIADGLVDLARQMAPTASLVAAGGTDDGRIGTSFDLVSAGIAEAEAGEGVAVLCDLGSAILTAETALDFLDDEERARVRIVDAPLVEGGVAAAVAAESGDDLDAVVAAAESARAGRQPVDGDRARPASAS